MTLIFFSVDEEIPQKVDGTQQHAPNFHAPKISVIPYH